MSPQLEPKMSGKSKHMPTYERFIVGYLQQFQESTASLADDLGIDFDRDVEPLIGLLVELTNGGVEDYLGKRLTERGWSEEAIDDFDPMGSEENTKLFMDGMGHSVAHALTTAVALGAALALKKV